MKRPSPPQTTKKKRVQSRFTARSRTISNSGNHPPTFPTERTELLDESPLRYRRYGLEDLDRALEGIFSDDDDDLWETVVQAIYNETGGSPDGFKLAARWTLRACDHWAAVDVALVWCHHMRAGDPEKLGYLDLLWLSEMQGNRTAHAPEAHIAQGVRG